MLTPGEENLPEVKIPEEQVPEEKTLEVTIPEAKAPETKVPEKKVMFKSGYCSIIGLPNSGKSSLLNAILGQKLSITTPKPQTTRKNILGIHTEPDHQVIFLDTPGIVKPSYLLQEKMLEEIGESLSDADVIIILYDIDYDPTFEKVHAEELIQKVLTHYTKPLIAVVNKIDKSNQEALVAALESLSATEKFKAVIPVSAAHDVNIKDVLQTVISHLPEGPRYYDEDVVSSESERFFVSEIIREKIFGLFSDEIPFSTEVEIQEFVERTTSKHFISAAIYVERDTQKQILIGAKGKAIKKIGEKARPDIEKFLDHEVYLELIVKVRDNWRTDEKMLKSFGYIKDEE